MGKPVRETKGSHHDEELSSRQLIVSSNNLVRDTMDSVHAAAATDKNRGALQLEKICSSLESKFPELSFTLGRAQDNDKQVLVVSQCVLAFMPPFGYTSRIRLTIQEDGRYRVHVLLRTLEDGTVSDAAEVYALLKKVRNPSYKFCPGIEWAHYHEHYFEVICFYSKSVRQTEAPFIEWTQSIVSYSLKFQLMHL